MQRPVRVAPAGHKVRISLGDAMTEATTAEVEALIAALGEARLQLQPPRQFEENPQPPQPIVYNALWWVRPMPQGVLLQLAHPSFGWLTFQLSDDHAQQIASLLVKYATER